MALLQKCRSHKADRMDKNMDTDKLHSLWANFLDVFNGRFSRRATRLGVFQRDHDVTNDFWIENGLPLIGIEIDTRRNIPAIRIDLDGYSHEVNGVLKLTIKLSTSGDEDGLDILDQSGTTTVLRMEAG